MGPWGIAVLAAGVALTTDKGRDYLKRLLKSGLLAGYRAKDSVTELADKAKKYGDDLIAEVKAENDALPNGKKSEKKSHSKNHS